MWSEPDISSFWMNITSRCLSKIYQKTLNLLYWEAVLGIFLGRSSHGRWLWGFLAPAGMEMLWEQQIPNAGSINFTSGRGLWSVPIPVDTWTRERMLCPPADFMLNIHTKASLKYMMKNYEEVNHEGWMFPHPPTAISLTTNFMRITLSEMEIYQKH